jgi:micrococcal nuclease
MSKRIFLFPILVTLILCFLPEVQSSCSGEIDETTVVSLVIDGDTFDVTSGDRIRLADIDAPEHYEEGYSESKNFLSELVHGKTVYLDIDDISRTDPYDRLVCVVYVDYNSTYVLNVNEALLEYEHAEIWNFTNNEFDPYEWSLYCPMEAIPEFPSFIILPLFMIATSLLVALCRRKHIL